MKFCILIIIIIGLNIIINMDLNIIIIDLNIIIIDLNIIIIDFNIIIIIDLNIINILIIIIIYNILINYKFLNESNFLFIIIDFINKFFFNI